MLHAVPTYQRRNMEEMGLVSRFCPYCREMINEDTKTVEHIIPKKEHGAHKDVRNLLWACATCNHRVKKDVLYATAGLRGVIFDKIYEDGVKRYVIKDPLVRRLYVDLAGVAIRAARAVVDYPN